MTSLCNLLHGKKVFLVCKWNFLYFNCCPLPIVLLLSTAEKKLALSSLLHLAPRYLYTFIRCRLSLLFPRLKTPSSLSPCLHGRCSSPLIIITALCWTASTKLMSLVLWSPQMDLALQIWPQQCLVEGKDHLPQPFDNDLPNVTQDVGCWPSLMQGLIAGLSSTSCPPVCPGVFLLNCFPASWPPACTGLWGYFSSGTGDCTSLCGTL